MTNQLFQWAVIGAGPAGIAAVGKLIDSGISPTHILWVDHAFSVGDLGQLWHPVSSNTTVGRFINFLEDAKSFNYSKSSDHFDLNNLPLNATCKLSRVVEPLQWISNHLSQRVHTVIEHIAEIQLRQRHWQLSGLDQQFIAKNVILATGAEPKTLNYPNINVIALNSIINASTLDFGINTNDTYAVFGSSHSAIIVLKHLVELGVKKIFNFYRSPCRYAVNIEDWILFDNTGLKGDSALWAKKYLDGLWPQGLKRYPVDSDAMRFHLSQCHHVVYAVGFEKRNSVIIKNYPTPGYNPHVGIIAPGLFGLGIAYPEIKQDKFGNIEHQVGLWKFMTYINKVMPLWLQYKT